MTYTLTVKTADDTFTWQYDDFTTAQHVSDAIYRLPGHGVTFSCITPDDCIHPGLFAHPDDSGDTTHRCLSCGADVHYTDL